MKNMLIKSAVAAAAICVVGIAQAIPITGNIGFTGQANLDSPSVGTATEVVTWANTVVNGDSGSFAGIALNTAASFAGATPWSFNSGALANFWSVAGFTFNLTSSAITTQTANFLGVTGTGMVSGNGYTPTVLNWSFSSQNPPISSGPRSFTFSASAASVPDGGTTAALLGGSLTMIGLIRRKQMIA